MQASTVILALKMQNKRLKQEAADPKFICSNLRQE